MVNVSFAADWRWLFFLSVAFSAPACEQVASPVQEPPFAGWPPYSSGVATYGYFYVEANTVGRGFLTTESRGKIYSSTDWECPILDGGTMTVSDEPSYFDHDYGYMAVGGHTFGDVGTFALSGNPELGIPGFTDSMYVPEAIRILSPATPNGPALNKGSGFTLQWNNDPDNDSVGIWLTYEVFASNTYDTSLGDGNFDWFVTVPDNGTYTVTSSALDGVPVGGVFSIHLFRGSHKLVGTSSRKYDAYAIAHSSGMFALTN